jgi:RNA polymerase sigma factor (sigma-70 family)
MADATTADLLKRLDRGDPVPARELYECIEKRLKAKVVRLIDRNPRLAGRVSPSDILQSVFVQLLRAGVPTDLRTGTGLVMATAQMRAAHHARAHGRKKRDRQKEDRSEEARGRFTAKGPSASKIACDAEEVGMAHAAIQEMSEADRTIITLHLDGKPWSEIGAQLGTKPDTARKRYNAALHRLRARLGVGGLAE